MSKINSIIKKLEYIGKLDTGKAGDENHQISPLLLEKTQRALLGVHTTGTEADRQRYNEALNNRNVQRALGLRKEM